MHSSTSPVKPPVSYYGGKIRMAGLIVKLIPKHTLYCEPYCGGAAVFFRKPPSDIEVLNDHEYLVVNFYKVLKDPLKVKGLQEMLAQTPYSRQQLHMARHLITHRHHFGEKALARAFWMLCNVGFSGTMEGGYSFTKTSNKTVKAFHRKKERINEALIQRLQNVDIEYREALDVIHSRDTENSFFYVDPPYVADSPVNQGHYAGFTQDNYEELLETLNQIKGKFLLSNYPSKLLSQYIKKHNRYVVVKETKITANNSQKGSPRRTKTEMLVANYPLSDVLEK